ncbi:MAG: Fic family protein [Pseudomonadota bacterium]
MNNIRTVLDRNISASETYIIPNLPLDIELEDKQVLKKSQEASRALAELKGFAPTIPNEHILINTLSLQEAKDSSAIENIITTHDELFQSDVLAGKFASPASKEVHAYAQTMREGYLEVKQTGLLKNTLIQKMQSDIEGNNAGFRTQSGTALKNDQTGEVIYMPPQKYEDILHHMNNLTDFINVSDLSDLDPIVKMAIIHHQFESIHPFFDGNGRTGRIINILYLVQQGLLDTPILYLSRYINQNKSEYYRLLQAVRDEEAWKAWILFILEGVRQTSYQTIGLIRDIKDIMQKHKRTMKQELPKIYSQDLLNNLFKHPYTKIPFVENELNVVRKTAIKYLDKLVEIEILSKHKIGRENYYFNDDLFNLLHNVGNIRLSDVKG